MTQYHHYEVHRPILVTSRLVRSRGADGSARCFDMNVARDRVGLISGASIRLNARRHGDAVEIPCFDLNTAVYARVHRQRLAGRLETHLPDFAMPRAERPIAPGGFAAL